MVPSGAVNPARFVTATKVPTLSNRSTNKNTNTISSTDSPNPPFMLNAAGTLSLNAVADRSARL